MESTTYIQTKIQTVVDSAGFENFGSCANNMNIVLEETYVRFELHAEFKICGIEQQLNN